MALVVATIASAALANPARSSAVDADR